MLLNSINDSVVYVPRAERVSFDMMVRYRFEGTRATVLLKDLSCNGARVEGIPHLRMGDLIAIMLPSLKPKDAEVVWTAGKGAGLQFERPLHPDIYEELVLHHGRRRERSDTDRLLQIESRYSSSDPVDMLRRYS
jgi:PilZ domain